MDRWKFKLTCGFILALLCGPAVFSRPGPAQPQETAPVPEMARLAKVLVGDWNTLETVQQGKPVPEGAGRRAGRYMSP